MGVAGSVPVKILRGYKRRQSPDCCDGAATTIFSLVPSYAFKRTPQ